MGRHQQEITSLLNDLESSGENQAEVIYRV